MAITPRSVVRSPLVFFLTVASVTLVMLVGAAILTLHAPTRPSSPCIRYRQHVVTPPQPYDVFTSLRSGPCGKLVEAFPADPDRWEQGYWEAAATCLDQRGDSNAVIQIAERGIASHPNSEILYNLKGIHEMELSRFADAATTLEVGLEQIGTPSNGVMENNLAWAKLWGTWRGESVALFGARTLYQNSLRRDPTSCEAIHTGMWVEYGLARRLTSAMNEGARDRYRELRADYAPCIDNRLEYGGDRIIEEVLGAGVLDHEMARLDAEAEGGEEHPVATPALISASVEEARERFDWVAPEKLCAGAVPVRSALGTCTQLVRGEAARAMLPTGIEAAR